MEPIIQVADLVKRYRQSDSNAVDRISFNVAPGELFTLLGPNGAGKTTTINILTTMLAPTSGRVLVAGHDLSSSPSRVRKNIGIIFQGPSLDVNLTAEENVRFHATLYGLYPFRPTFSMMPRSYKKQLFDLTSVLGIENEIFKPVKTFSGGMKRKLEIVRSLMHHPRVLFLDEPTTGLDAASRRSLWEYLDKVRAERETTIFLTTHYLEEAEHADTICIINKGRIISLGTPHETKAMLLQQYLIVDAENRQVLREELASLAIPFNETPLFRIDLNGHSAHQLLRSISTPLTMVKTHTPTLEDAYLAIVGHA